MGASELRKSQLEDPIIRPIIESFDKNTEDVLRYTERGYLLIDGVLFRYCSEENTENGQLVVPNSLKSKILYDHHDSPFAGHYGIERTVNRICSLYYWPGIRKDIATYVKNCVECKKYKPTNLKPAGLMQSLSSNKRFEIIAIDLFGPLPITPNGNQWIFVIEDIASRWTELFPMKTSTAENCAMILLNEIILRYGTPRRIHSDNGVQFISALMQKLMFCLGIEQSFTPFYHPEANPVERKNRDIKTQLAICVGTKHTEWDIHIPAIRFAMNSSLCQATGFTAAFLTFGRELRSPTEAFLDFKAIVKAENFIPQITPHLLRLQDSLELAKETEEQLKDKNKHYVDSKRRPQTGIEIGDKVLVNTHVLSNREKGLSSKFVPRRDGPYVVIARKGSSCFQVAAENNPQIPVGVYHASALTRFDGLPNSPIYPIQKRGRPAQEKLSTVPPQKDGSQPAAPLRRSPRFRNNR